MKVVVCVKQTPSTTAVFSVENGAVSWDDPGGKPNVVNPWDEYAIEEAIRLKENHGASDAIAAQCGAGIESGRAKNLPGHGLHGGDPRFR